MKNKIIFIYSSIVLLSQPSFAGFSDWLDGFFGKKGTTPAGLHEDPTPTQSRAGASRGESSSPTKPSVAAPSLPPKPATLAPAPVAAQALPLTADEIQMQHWKSLADRGDIEAAYELGYKYSTGYQTHIAGIKEEVKHFNKELAIHYLYQAASRGHYFAIISLIPALEGPTNLNLTRIVQVLTAKMMQGDIQAKYSLGSMYLGGKGVAKDEMKAFQYIREAAAAGDINAEGLMSSIYFKGLCGQGKNLDLALHHALREAQLEGKDSMWTTSRLAAIYRVKDNVPLFIEYTLKAAELGDGPSQHLAGQFYHKGVPGVQQNLETAKRWYTLAAHQGIEKSKERLAEFSNN